KLLSCPVEKTLKNTSYETKIYLDSQHTILREGIKGRVKPAHGSSNAGTRNYLLGCATDAKVSDSHERRTAPHAARHASLGARVQKEWPEGRAVGLEPVAQPPTGRIAIL